MKSKFTFTIFTMIAFVFLSGTLQAQDSTMAKEQKKQHGQRFVDKDGDGYNDNAPDHDGDGVPNGLDPDWQKLKKGKSKGKRHRFVDLDGDGINDNLQLKEQKKAGKQKRIKDGGGSLKDGQKQNRNGSGKKKHGHK